MILSVTNTQFVRSYYKILKGLESGEYSEVEIRQRKGAAIVGKLLKKGKKS